MKFISFSRTAAMVVKEFRQILRDRATLAMIIAMPLMLMLLFGYAINNNPRHLPAAGWRPLRAMLPPPHRLRWPRTRGAPRG